MRELLTVFLVTLAAFTSMIIFGGVATNCIQQSLGFNAIVKIVPYIIPVAFQVSLPATILMAASTVYGRMSADNEVVAIKSMGISPFTILTPVFLLAFIVSFVAVWANDMASSWSKVGLHRVVLESVEEVVYRKLKMQRSYHSPSFSINVKDVIGRKLIQPSIQMHGTGGRTIRIHGSSAELSTDAERNMLTVLMTDVRFDQGETSMTSDEEKLEISLDAATRKGDVRDSPSVVPLWQMQNATRAQRVTTEQLERNGATTAAFQMMTGDFFQLVGERELATTGSGDSRSARAFIPVEPGTVATLGQRF